MSETMPSPLAPGALRRLARALPLRLRRGAAARRAGAGRAFALPLVEAAPERRGAAESGMRLGRNLGLYHDGDAAAVACACGPGLAVRLSCGPFGGSYLSLVASVPEALTLRFGPGRVLRLGFEAETTRPLVAWLRLNIGSADGHETHHETLVVRRGARTHDFDLDGVRLPFDCRLRAWADIIFSRPEDCDISLAGIDLAVVGKHEL